MTDPQRYGFKITIIGDGVVGKTSLIKKFTKCSFEKDQYCDDIPVLLFANKVDLVSKDKINKTEIQKFVKKYHFFDYCITSAKTGESVIEAFNAIIEKLYFKYKQLSTGK